MSAFLGPVHQWMYQKIGVQETFTARLLALSADNALSERLVEKFGAVDTAPLEQIIDQNNIHGWLNGRVQRAEGRFSDAVETLLTEFGGSLTALTEVAYQMGREHAVPSGASVSAAYQALDSLFLDGMPCDGGRLVLSEDSDELTFQYESALHTLCKQGEVGLNAFTALRESFLNGMLADSGLRSISLGAGSYKLIQESEHVRN